MNPDTPLIDPFDQPVIEPQVIEPAVAEALPEDNLLISDSVLTLAGQVARVMFHDAESGFFVAQMKLAQPKELVTFVGYLPSIQVGESLQATGSWVNDRRHGLQFRCQQINSLIPTTLEGMEKYLASGLIQGIGAHFAKKLIAEFGDQVFDVIENQPERLQELDGIGKKRQEDISQAWQQQKNLREIMVFLHSHDLGTARAYRIVEAYGDQAIDRVKANPYQLVMDVQGVGFKTADQLAQQLGVLPESAARIQAALSYVLKMAGSEGHCGLPTAELLARTEELIGVDAEIIRPLLEQACQSRQLCTLLQQQQTYVGLPSLMGAEQQVVYHLQRLINQPMSWPLLLPLIPAAGDADSASSASLANGQSLSEDQQQAVRLALSNKLCVLTGGPGVGKTTVLQVITRCLRQAGLNLLLAAPTGRAAKRLSESTGLTAKTLHRLLQYDPTTRGFKHNASNLLVGDFLIVDEASMVDVALMAHLLQALPDAMAVLWVGDVDQLPSVGPGNVLADMINSGRLPVIRLHKIFRQAAQSEIVQQAHRVNQGHCPQMLAARGDTALSDFYLIETRHPVTAMQTLLEVVSERIPQRFGLDPTRDIQVLTPMQRGGLGARSLNTELQQKLNPNASLKVERFGACYALGDKVIQVINNYDKQVFNGDIGCITRITPDAQQLTISFMDRDVEYKVDELDEVQLAYAITIHKSQGSEYPCVVMPILMQHFRLLQRNLLYTGMTRAKQLLVVIAQTQALRYAVENQQSQQRYTFLAEMLRKV